MDILKRTFHRIYEILFKTLLNLGLSRNIIIKKF